LIELKQGSIVKQYPANIAVPLKLATATLAFLLLTILLTGRTDETRITLPVQEEAVTIHSDTLDEKIDYDELLNRIPLRKPAPKPAWMDWTSGKKQFNVFG
jgi:hypothetical protein